MEVVNLATVESVELFPNISISGDIDIVPIATESEVPSTPVNESAQ
ncbi:hypothetical protein O59_004063 [Cellvibrio sp. BR]|nr:hypothetical protein O59_004063 [Cellvibrio sp. BR]